MERYDQPVNIRVSRRMMRHLDAEARRRYTSRSALARQLLAKGLGMVPNGQTQAPIQNTTRRIQNVS